MGLNYKEIIMIYFLEDDKNIRDFVLYTLNAQGFKAMGFERPSIFWNAMDEETPSLILLDIMLPEEDGLSILRKLRGDKATAKLPVIMLTAKRRQTEGYTARPNACAAGNHAQHTGNTDSIRRYVR